MATSDSRLEMLLAEALEMQARGETIDLASLCAEAPDLRDAVAAALDLNQELHDSIGHDPWLGTTLSGRYELVDWLGAGAMGVVYVGHDRSLGREVAVKVLQQGVFAAQSRRDRFAREARVLASLKHAHIVQIYDHGISEQGLHYIVMARVRGRSMAKILHDTQDSSSAPSDWLAHAVTWCAQIASALAVAHGLGVLHRDVKPSNILVTEDGDAILADFGIAHQVGETALTAGGTTLGTPSYMAPEQARDATQLTEQADVYGLCSTLYHLATFRPPFEGDYHAVLAQLRRGDALPPKRVAPKLPADLCAIIERGMHRDPRQRYSDMRTLERDLRAFLEHRPVQARPVTWIGRRMRSVRRHPARVATVLIGASVLAISLWSYGAHVEAQQRQKEKRSAEYETNRKSWPPSAAIEGSLATRKLIPAEERRDMIRHARRMIELMPRDREARSAEIALLLDDGQHEAAADRFAEFREYEADEGVYVSELASRYRDANREETGAAALRLEELPTPKTELARYLAGFLALRRKQYGDARSHLLQAGKRASTLSTSLHVMLSLAQRRTGDERRELLDEVVRTGRTLAELRGFETAKTRYFAATAAGMRKNYELAQSGLEASMALCKSFGTTINLGNVFAELGDFVRAEDLARAAQAIRPANRNADALLVAALCGQRRFDDARDVAEALPEQAYLSHRTMRGRLLRYIDFRQVVYDFAQGRSEQARILAIECIASFEEAAGSVSPNAPSAPRMRDERDFVRTVATNAFGIETLALSMRIAKRGALDPLRLRIVAMLFSKLSSQDETSTEEQKRILTSAAKYLLFVAERVSALSKKLEGR